MVKKILFSVISLTVLYLGHNSFNQLRYWDRSVQIFKLNSEQTFGRGFNRGRPTFNRNSNTADDERFGGRGTRSDFENLPDSVRQQFAQQQFQVQPDSLRRQNRTEFQRFDRGSFRGQSFDENSRQRRGFQQRRNIRLNTVYRFLAVFAALTALTIYLDKAYKTLRKKKKFSNTELQK